jgi:hypothetical protein
VRNGYLSAQIEKTALMICIPLTIIAYAKHVGSCRRQNKNPRIYAWQFLHSPQENIWVWLRQSLEKIAPQGDNFRFSSDLVAVLRQSSNLFRAKLVSSAPTPVPAKLARVQPEKPPLELFLNSPPHRIFSF